ncbi:anhydro-N-acetylmuramic acid kinase [Corallibacter sp.]|uniref:anhydro-N-acetylmuramic acid kinase n=1 Tax=Corallibacter sp. TaxID=2038084 RepID=UPI003A9404C5
MVFFQSTIVIFTDMIKKYYNVIGVMSGTSLDGVDLVYVTFTLNDTWEFTTSYSETYAYPDKWKLRLSNLTDMSNEDLKVFDKDYTAFLADRINTFIRDNNLVDIDFIASHGHTALHQPDLGLTYQIGNLPEISKILNKTVVCDFRTQDVALGGQGAPLVPVGDKLLFSNYDYCINLGGFANISSEFSGNRIAYDICPVNIVLNYYVSQLGKLFDDKGAIAKSGNVHQELLSKLNSLKFYEKSLPKSLGLEWVKESIFSLISKYNIDTKDILRTFVEHIADQIAKEINQTKKSTVLITGGGAYNTFLISKIKEKTKHEISIPNSTIIEFKEAIIFGFLGVLKLRNEVNCLASVTGAKFNHSSGVVYRI